MMFGIPDPPIARSFRTLGNIDETSAVRHRMGGVERDDFQDGQWHAIDHVGHGTSTPRYANPWRLRPIFSPSFELAAPVDVHHLLMSLIGKQDSANAAAASL